MQHGDVTTIVTLDFLRLPLIAGVGVLFYREPFELSLIIGGVIMLSANVIGARR
jgi:drug/metabolite transporter (DMT)-like permease